MDAGDGSRLPPPPTWFMTETLRTLALNAPTSNALRQAGLQPGLSRGLGGSAGARPGRPWVHPTGAALALALGLEQRGSLYLAYCIPGGAAQKLAAAVQAAYLHDSAELVRLAADHPSARRGLAGAGAGAGTGAGPGLSRGQGLESIAESGGFSEEEEEEHEVTPQWRERWTRWALAALTCRYGLEPPGPPRQVPVALDV
jgi:hypothetical protein